MTSPNPLIMIGIAGVYFLMVHFEFPYIVEFNTKEDLFNKANPFFMPALIIFGGIFLFIIAYLNSDGDNDAEG